MTLASAANPAELSIHVIGHADTELPRPLAKRIAMTGEYEEADLPALLAKVKPHVVWFPGQCPETYSYTLTTAIDAGLPIVATQIGAFPERLEGRPLTWLVDPEASPEEWLAVFAKVRGALTSQRKPPAGRPRQAVADYYRDHYVKAPAVRAAGELVDLRSDERVSVVVIPERFPSGALTPCSYIRLLQPLDHPAIGGDFDIVLADADEALNYRADIIVTQRYAVEDLDAAESSDQALREHGITLLYDLDDDLRHIPRDHPDAQLLRPRARTVSRLVRGADAVWVSTPALAATLAELRDDVRVVENGLDERLWAAAPPPTPPRQGPVRILFMGTATHDADFAIVEGALARLKSVFAEYVAIDLARYQQPLRHAVLGQPCRHAGASEWVVSRLRQLDHAAALGHRHRSAHRYFVQPLQVRDQDAGLCGDRLAGARVRPRGVSRLVGRRPRRLAAARR